jgi:nucleoside-diphosphate-sugar epimerase
VGRSVFVAGAAGAIGQVLVRLLVADGWRVFGATRSAERAAGLAALGAEPVLVDVFDLAALQDAARRTLPAALVHQLTDLPRTFDPRSMPQALERNALIREQGTQNLLQAFRSAPVRRLVVQSIAFAYAPGVPPYSEADSLDVDAPDPGSRRSARAVAAMEGLALASGFEAVILRYGKFYGPRTWSNAPAPECAVHVEAAADAARLALAGGQPGVYNVAEPGGSVNVRKALAQLGWNPAFRLEGAD